MARDKGRGGIFEMDGGPGMFVCCNWIRRGGSVIGGLEVFSFWNGNYILSMFTHSNRIKVLLAN